MSEDIRPSWGTYDLDQIDRYIGSRLRRRRVVLGMTQKELAEALDLTFQQIQKYEQGVNRVCASRLYQLSHILKVPLTYFFQDEEEPLLSSLQESVSEAYTPDPVSKEATELIHVYYQIRESKIRRRILELARTLADSEHFSLPAPLKEKNE